MLHKSWFIIVSNTGLLGHRIMPVVTFTYLICKLMMSCYICAKSNTNGVPYTGKENGLL